VKAFPGEDAKDIIFAVFLAITFPFSGVARGLEAIVRGKFFYRPAHDLRTAVRAGALCIVIRDEKWQPVEPRSIGASVQIKGIKTYGEFPTVSLVVS
jgi:hypothetical protein